MDVVKWRRLEAGGQGEGHTEERPGTHDTSEEAVPYRLAGLWPHGTHQTSTALATEGGSETAEERLDSSVSEALGAKYWPWDICRPSMTSVTYGGGSVAGDEPLSCSGIFANGLLIFEPLNKEHCSTQWIVF